MEEELVIISLDDLDKYLVKVVKQHAAMFTPKKESYDEILRILKDKTEYKETYRGFYGRLSDAFIDDIIDTIEIVIDMVDIRNEKVYELIPREDIGKLYDEMKVITDEAKIKAGELKRKICYMENKRKEVLYEVISDNITELIKLLSEKCELLHYDNNFREKEHIFLVNIRDASYKIMFDKTFMNIISVGTHFNVSGVHEVSVTLDDFIKKYTRGIN